MTKKYLLISQLYLCLNFILIVSIFCSVVICLGDDDRNSRTIAENEKENIFNDKDKRNMREKVFEMFKHAYFSYMNNAYPADELMPLSCKGRYRDVETSRGDIDDTLGNFTLTLIDSLDTLAVVGMLDEFERAVYLITSNVTFNTDVVVSVFETNIRVLGGLLGAHFVAIDLKSRKIGMLKYKDELLTLAVDIGNRLLPAFNTTTGIPYPRVNLRYGINPLTSRTGFEKDTCTSCAGTMILEFAALSRLTGNPIYEAHARQAMDFLWHQRHRSSDLVGTVINIHNGNWVRRESGVGAGIDSYYEYVFKAYILLGDYVYRDRFDTHYAAIMRYINQGALLVNVHMHQPESSSRSFMDSLLAFWPGLQVLKGDVRPAIETHEILYQIVQRHKFLPEAFTKSFRIHWAQHPLRPEFVESTYFLYKATGDPYYLTVGEKVVENMEQYARVACGYAAIKDLHKGTHEDQMDSYVLAETFKYLYLLFTDKHDLTINVDQYIFTTEAHLLPLSLATCVDTPSLVNHSKYIFSTDGRDETKYDAYDHTCPNSHFLYKGDKNYAHTVRAPLRDRVINAYPFSTTFINPPLSAKEFNSANKNHLYLLQQMGIRVQSLQNGRMQLFHTASQALSENFAESGLLFMQELLELSNNKASVLPSRPLYVEVIEPSDSLKFQGGPAQFGYDLSKHPPVIGNVVTATPTQACSDIENTEELAGHIAIVDRGGCMFVEKARYIEKAQAIGGIVIDTSVGSTAGSGTALFAMSGDGTNDVNIPMVFLYHKEGSTLRDLLSKHRLVTVKLNSLDTISLFNLTALKS